MSPYTSGGRIRQMIDFKCDLARRPVASGVVDAA
jgi:hypothetical protein